MAHLAIKVSTAVLLTGSKPGLWIQMDLGENIGSATY